MKTSLILGIAATIGLTFTATASDWSYEGENGPGNWSTISAECGMHEQSPVNLANGIKAALPGMVITQGFLTGDFVNNGHTLQLTAGLENALKVGETDYNLQHFQFHASSEHAIDGSKMAMELQFVYQAADQSMAIIGIMIKEGAENPELAKLWASIPEGSEPALVKNVDMSALMPQDMSHYYRYEGSLTMPPCSQNVTWTVMKNPIEASKGQIDAFAGLFTNNARPVQSTGRRYILQSF